jgi:hypothetical protein
VKIGLMTVYYPNYGSYFQAIALKNHIENKGHSCELINATIRGKYIFKFCLGAMGESILPLWICQHIAKKNAAFRTYLSLAPDIKKLKISKPFKSLKKLSKEYDCILVGSDELWSASLWEMKYIPAYFGIGLRCPHFSYATSGASLNFTVKLPWHKIVKGLKSFEALSGRDEKTCNFIQAVTNRTCTKCLDPVLLNPYFIKRSNTAKNYLLVYGVEFSKSDINKIKTYAARHHLVIRGVSWKHEWFDEFYEITSPNDFLKQFSESMFCAVSTFHGAVFSILYHKPFAVFLTRQRAPKIFDLLKTLNLTFRIANRVSELGKLPEIDFSIVEERLCKLREESNNYLTNALEIMEKRQ